MRCLLGHRWRLIATDPYLDTSFGMQMPSTLLIRRCERCGKINDRQILYGAWTVEQLTR